MHAEREKRGLMHIVAFTWPPVLILSLSLGLSVSLALAAYLSETLSSTLSLLLSLGVTCLLLA